MAGLGGRTVVEKNKFKEARAVLDAAIRVAIIEANAAGKATAKAEVAVDTGNLKNSIQGHMTGKLSSEIVTGVEYAPYQEYGTRYQSGKQYMRPAAKKAGEVLQDEVNKIEPALIAAVMT
jgi:HK97 gp10 family phage protein